MNIIILARNPNLYSHQRLLASGTARGHQMRIINTLHCYMNIVSGKPAVHCRGGEVLKDVDAVIPRIGASITFYGTAVVRQFEMMGVYVLNSSQGIAQSRDKLCALQLLVSQGINLPTTGFAYSLTEMEDLIAMVGGTPLVVKLLEGTQGIGVVLAEGDQSAKSVIGAFHGAQAPILVQEFIKEAEGKDIRCFVIGDAVVASMQREAKIGEFRSNMHQGGRLSVIEITEEERSMAIRAVQVLGLSVAGVDIMRSVRDPMVIEVNSSPGLEGIEQATGLDIASMIIECIETRSLSGK